MKDRCTGSTCDVCDRLGGQKETCKACVTSVKAALTYEAMVVQFVAICNSQYKI